MRIAPLAILLCLAAPAAASNAAPKATTAGTAPMAVAPTAAMPVWRNAAGSTLGFASSYDGEAFSGQFRQFTATLRFDPARLAESRFDVTIQLASASTANDERDETLQGADFFHSAAMPQARYTATAFRRLADGRFVADGVLELRGVRRTVPLTFRWTPGAAPRLDGSATVPRLAFNVGGGDWADVEVLPDAVAVTTRLTLQPSR